MTNRAVPCKCCNGKYKLTLVGWTMVRQNKPSQSPVYACERCDEVGMWPKKMTAK